MNFMFEYQEQYLTSERILITEFLMTFRKFATTFQKLKLSEDNLKFPRLWKTAENLRGRPEVVLIIHQRIEVQFKGQKLY